MLNQNTMSNHVIIGDKLKLCDVYLVIDLWIWSMASTDNFNVVELAGPPTFPNFCKCFKSEETTQTSLGATANWTRPSRCFFAAAARRAFPFGFHINTVGVLLTVLATDKKSLKSWNETLPSWSASMYLPWATSNDWWRSWFFWIIIQNLKYPAFNRN